MKKTAVFFFFLIAGTVTGAMLAAMTAGVPLLGWLSYSTTVGIPFSSPLVLDLAIIKLSFAAEMGINAAQIATITIAMLVYRHIAQKL